jgi:hypothetical protein
LTLNRRALWIVVFEKQVRKCSLESQTACFFLNAIRATPAVRYPAIRSRQLRMVWRDHLQNLNLRPIVSVMTADLSPNM